MDLNEFVENPSKEHATLSDHLKRAAVQAQQSQTKVAEIHQQLQQAQAQAQRDAGALEALKQLALQAIATPTIAIRGDDEEVA